MKQNSGNQMLFIWIYKQQRGFHINKTVNLLSEKALNVFIVVFVSFRLLICFVFEFINHLRNIIIRHTLTKLLFTPLIEKQSVNSPIRSYLHNEFCFIAVFFYHCVIVALSNLIMRNPNRIRNLNKKYIKSIKIYMSNVSCAF